MKYLLLLLFPFSTYGQQVWKSYYKATDDFCNLNITLYEDSTYLYETGCEERSNVNIGNWNIDKDTILLTPIQLGKFKSLIHVSKNEKKDTSSPITIVDKYNSPIPNFGIIIIPPRKKYKLSSIDNFFFYEFEINKTEIIISSKTTDESGTIYLNSREKYLIQNRGFVLRLIGTELFGDENIIKFKKYINRAIEIKLDINKDIFKYPSSKWLFSNQKKLKYKEGKIDFIEKE